MALPLQLPPALLKPGPPQALLPCLGPAFLGCQRRTSEKGLVVGGGLPRPSAGGRPRQTRPPQQQWEAPHRAPGAPQP